MISSPIFLSKDLTNASKKVANKLGISQTQFIHQAIIHAIESFKSQFEQEAMAKSLKAMANCPSYLAEAEEIMEGLN